jgi:hypothetical protein
MKWLRQYVVWILLGVVVLVWEVLGVKRVAKFLSLPPAIQHPSISEIEWSLPAPVRVLVDVFLVDLIAHFTFHTSLIPGVG